MTHSKADAPFFGYLSHIFMVSVTCLQAWKLKKRTADILNGPMLPESTLCLVSKTGTSTTLLTG